MRYFYLLLLFFPLSAMAQLSVGLGAGYGTELKLTAAQLRVSYQFGNDFASVWSLHADGDYYFSKLDFLRVYEANLNVHYIFIEDDHFQPYALAGLNVYIANFKGIDTFTDTGVNVGGGLGVSLGSKITLFGELRYAISDANQFFIGSGILFNF